jgi:hypothetical protein
VSTAKKNTNAQTAGQTSLVFAQSPAVTRVGCLIGLSTNASTAMTSLWHDLTMALPASFAVENAFWKTAFNLSTKSARTAAACLLQRDQQPLPVAMGGGCIALRNAM